MNLWTGLAGCQAPVESIRLYLIQVEAVKKFSFGTWTSRQHVFFEFCAGGHSGWAENILSTNRPDADTHLWEQKLQALIGLPVAKALDWTHSQVGQWDSRLSEAAEAALIDLGGKLTDQNALELLGLPGRAPIYGVHVILSDDIAFVRSQARWALENNRSRYIKVKLFGDPALDVAVIRAVREECPREKTFLIGDVNCGYQTDESAPGNAKLLENLHALYAAGLDACEDPAGMQAETWVQIQKQAGGLSLIPDVPMRPAAEAARSLLPGMGGIYNIHPGCTASILDALVLARRIQQTGAKLMIGDDSLIGPGCTIWQQLAAGLCADWVEATEKAGESDFYLQAVRQSATAQTNPIAIRMLPGFGLQLDAERIAASAVSIARIGPSSREFR